MTLRYKPATGIWRYICRRYDFDAIFTPWKTVYFITDSAEMRRHEEVHEHQLDHDGRILWTIRWLWWTLRYGYERNPYERHARMVAERGGVTNVRSNEIR